MAKIKCRECKSIAEETETYCPECGAIFVQPFLYLEAEKKKEQDLIASATQKKSPEQMNKEEKLKFLDEKCHDIRDELVKLRHHINEKANECMRCFTAAGIARANNFDDDIANMVYKRKENLEDIDLVLAEYRVLLQKMDTFMIELENAKEEVENFKKEK